jgi:hypothetical protein
MSTGGLGVPAQRPRLLKSWSVPSSPHLAVKTETRLLITWKSSIVRHNIVVGFQMICINSVMSNTHCLSVTVYPLAFQAPHFCNVQVNAC